MAETIQLNDIGTIFEIEIQDNGAVLDISAATIKEIVFKKPKTATLPEETVTKTASFTTNGLDGLIRYVTVLGDLDRVGTWQIQAKITLPDWNGRSEISKFKVIGNL